MVWLCFFLSSVGQVIHARLDFLQVDIAQPAVEKDFARVELVFEAELLVVDRRIASQVQQCIVEVGEGLFEVTDEKVRYSLLEVRYGKVFV